MNLIPLIVLKHEKAVNTSVRPALVLQASNWDDYGYKTSFSLKYRHESGQEENIGDVKIGSTNYKQSDYNHVDEMMLDYYEDGKLPDHFFSLGQDLEYYKNFRKLFPQTFKEILTNLKDCVALPTLEEQIELNDVFKTSLIRSEFGKEAQIALDYGSDILDSGMKKRDLIFDYNFCPFQEKNPLKIHFDFNGSNLFSRRLYAIIGDNGVGKTTLLNDIPQKLLQQKIFQNEQYFSPFPSLKKVITISLNQYDNFEPPSRSSNFNYVYCGLIDKKNGKEYSHNNVVNKTIDSLFYIIKHNRENYLNFVVDELLGENLFCQINSILYDYERERKAEELCREELCNVLNCLSSGQNALLNVFSNVIAEIRYKSLLLLDEPEIHLHPKAIAKLVKVLLRILDKYESFCIVATHSPLVIRELTSDCVYIMEKIDDERTIRFIGFESLGANLTTLTNGIFGINDEKSYFIEKILALKKDGYNENEILLMVKSKTGHAVSLSLRLYIASIFNQDEEA